MNVDTREARTASDITVSTSLNYCSRKQNKKRTKNKTALQFGFILELLFF